jgi:hypothetical protein
MSKRKKKQIKERKHAMRLAKKTAETVLSALNEKPVQIKHQLRSKTGPPARSAFR